MIAVRGVQDKHLLPAFETIEQHVDKYQLDYSDFVDLFR